MRLKNDLMRHGVLITVATVFVFFSARFALFVGEPSFSAWGLFAGLALYGVALSHALRRLMFPYIDLQKFASAASGTSTGAGLVFIGVCIVLATFLSMMGSLVHG